MKEEQSRPPCINGFYIPQYYRFKDFFCIGAAPRSGSTSLHFLAEEHKAEKLDSAPSEAVCIIRHPIKRLASAFVLLPLEARRIPIGDGQVNRQVMRPPIEEVIDAVLDDVAGEFFTAKIGNSAHAFAWQRQSSLYEECANPIWLRLEGNEGFYGMFLPLYNQSDPEEKPEVTHRLAELETYYEEDLELWRTATTKID